MLREGGLLIASYLGAGMAKQMLPLPWDESRTGMLVIAKGAPWDLGGPAVFHSEWWLREHWGRLFDVVTLDDHDGRQWEHGWLVLHCVNPLDRHVRYPRSPRPVFRCSSPPEIPLSAGP